VPDPGPQFSGLPRPLRIANSRPKTLVEQNGSLWSQRVGNAFAEGIKGKYDACLCLFHRHGDPLWAGVLPICGKASI
jgi:hypothetical protein